MPRILDAFLLLATVTLPVLAAQWTGWQTIKGEDEGLGGGVDLSHTVLTANSGNPNKFFNETYFRFRNRFAEPVFIDVLVSYIDTKGQRQESSILSRIKPGAIAASGGNWLPCKQILSYRIKKFEIEGRKRPESPASGGVGEIEFGAPPRKAPSDNKPSGAENPPTGEPSIREVGPGVREITFPRQTPKPPSTMEEIRRRQAADRAKAQQRLEQAQRDREAHQAEHRRREEQKVSDLLEDQQERQRTFNETQQRGLQDIQRAFDGIERRRNNPNSKECPSCDGTGQIGCTACFSSGIIVSVPKNLPCKVCGADGKITCFRCSGKGQTK